MNLVQFGFRLLYNEFAWTYDVVSWSVSLGRWRVWQLATLDFVEGGQVLEIAHGPGHMLQPLHDQGHRVIAGDLSPSMSALAQNRLKRAGLSRSIDLMRFALPDLPLPTASVDTVLSQFPTAFIVDPATIAEIYRVLAPGGRLVILPEGHLTGRGPIRRVIAWLFQITGQSAEGENVIAEALRQRWSHWESDMHTAGFKVEIQILDFPGSQATVIVATKPGLNSI